MNLNESLKHFFTTNEQTVLNLNEASALTASGSGKGGRALFDKTSVALRQGNPLRTHARIEKSAGKSDVSFSMKTGNNTGGASAVAWGYNVPSSTNTTVDTVYWQLPMRVVSGVVPIRTAALQDVENLDGAVLDDILYEVSTIEGTSMARNNDSLFTPGTALSLTGSGAVTVVGPDRFWSGLTAATNFPANGTIVLVAGNTGAGAVNNGQWAIFSGGGTTTCSIIQRGTSPQGYSAGAVTLTPQTLPANADWLGGQDGLRGLNSYTASSTPGYGTSGIGAGYGLHTIDAVGGATLSYDVIANIASELPPQYWVKEGTAWQIHPTQIGNLRKIKDANGLPVFLEIGDYDAAPVGMMMGFPVLPNNNLPASGAGSIYLANWPEALTIVDDGELVLKKFEETTPGTTSIYFERRLLSTVRNPFAIVRWTAV